MFNTGTNIGKEVELLREKLNASLDALKGNAVNFAYRFISDHEVRQQYLAQIQGYAKSLLQQIAQDSTTVQAAKAAYDEAVYLCDQTSRVLAIIQGRTSATCLGTQDQKAPKLSTNTKLQNDAANKLFKKDFAALEANQQHQVWLEIIKSSNHNTALATESSKLCSDLGKGIALFTAAISTYNFYCSENQSRAFVREIAQMAGSRISALTEQVLTQNLNTSPISSGIAKFVGGVLGTITEAKTYFVPTLATQLQTLGSLEQKLNREVLDPFHSAFLASNTLIRSISQVANGTLASSSAKTALPKIIGTISNFLETFPNITTATLDQAKELIKNLTTGSTKLTTNLCSLSQLIVGETTRITKSILTSYAEEKINGLKKETAIILQQQNKFAAILQCGNSVAEGLSLLSTWTKNPELQKAAGVISSTLKIGQTIASFATTGMLATASFVPVIGGAVAILGSLASIAGVFSSDGDGNEEMIKAMFAALQQISEQINQLRTEMHQRFDQVMTYLESMNLHLSDKLHSLQSSVNIISTKIDYLHQDQQREHQRQIIYLATLAKNIEAQAVQAQNQDKSDKVKALIGEITQKSLAFETDSNKYSELRAALSAYLTRNIMGSIKCSEFTGSACPELKNPQALVKHIDNFPVDFHLGTLAALYEQFKPENQSYSIDMLSTYLQEKILKEKQNFKLHPCLAIADLELIQQQQDKVFGLEAAIKTFLFATDAKETAADTLIIPMCLQAKWQLILVNKPFQQVFLFTPPGQDELQQRIVKIIKKSVTTDFICQKAVFNGNIAPIYYGTLVVEIIRLLSNHELYDAVLAEQSNAKLEQLYKAQMDDFKPSAELQATRLVALKDTINPSICQLLTWHLLGLYYNRYKYPTISANNTTTFAIKKTEVADIAKTLLALDNVYYLYQFCCNENLLNKLFSDYQKAARGLEGELTKYREAYEEVLTGKLNIAAKERLLAKFMDQKLKEQFEEEKITIKTYGNWFKLTTLAQSLPWEYAEFTRVTTVMAQNAATNYIYQQENQIKQRKQLFLKNLENVVENWSKYEFVRINLYDQSNYTFNSMPFFILPEQKDSPILPNLSFSRDAIPNEIFQAQAMGLGHIEFRYNFNVADNKFNIKANFLMDNNTISPCFTTSATEYNKNNAVINFYQSQEAVWWFWVGGIVPKLQTFPENGSSLAQTGSTEGTHVPLGFITVLETEIKGASALPASAFTQKVDTSGPLMVEIRRRLNAKYLELQTALNRELSAELNNPATALGKALLEFEQAYRILRLFIDFIFIFPGATDANSLLYALLNNDTMIYNREKLMIYLSGQTDEFVATRIAKDTLTLITSLQALCLSLLPAQAHNTLPQIASLQQELLQADDYFLPLQVEQEPLVIKEQSCFDLLKQYILGRKMEIVCDQGMRMVDLLGKKARDEEREEMVKEVKEKNALIAGFDDTFNKVIEPQFRAGKINLDECYKQAMGLPGSSYLLPLLPPTQTATTALAEIIKTKSLHQDITITSILSRYTTARSSSTTSLSVTAHSSSSVSSMESSHVVSSATAISSSSLSSFFAPSNSRITSVTTTTSATSTASAAS